VSDIMVRAEDHPTRAGSNRTAGARAGRGFGDHSGPYLAAGQAVAPIFLGVSLIVAANSAQFSPVRHQLSLLLVGPWGWLETIAFVVTGVCGVLAAVGARRALRPGAASRAFPLLLGAYGVLLAVAGGAHPDAQLGFPPGAPDRAPNPPSAAAAVHSLAFSLLAVAVVAAGLVLARRFAADGDRVWTGYCIANSVAIIVLTVAGSALTPAGFGGLPLFAVAACISCWVSAIAWRLKESQAD
jgi:hypothetical protein